MPYKEMQLLSISLMTNFILEVNNQDLDSSIAIMIYTKYASDFSVLDTTEVRITGEEIRGIIPDLDVVLTTLANIYNPYDPNAKRPLSSIVNETIL